MLNYYFMRRNFWLWLAVRSTLTGVAATVVAFVLQGTALPKLTQETRELRGPEPAAIKTIGGLGRALPLVPAPAIVLGLAAIILPTFRRILAPLAAVAAVIGLVAVVGTLIAAMLPLYQMPRELEGLT